ncbi:MAG: hypothetical protein ABIG69_18355, partial [Bacteroidota bacterium]
ISLVYYGKERGKSTSEMVKIKFVEAGIKPMLLVLIIAGIIVAGIIVLLVAVIVVRKYFWKKRK